MATDRHLPADDPGVTEETEVTKETYKVQTTTIASKLRKLFSTKGQTVAKALPEEMPGGGSNIMLVGVNIDSDSGDAVLDKTWKEIHDALASGTPVYVKYTEPTGSYVACAVWPVLYAYMKKGNYGVILVYDHTIPSIIPSEFTASSENDYPEVSLNAGVA